MNEMWNLLDLDFIQNWCDRTGCVLLTPEDVEKIKKVKDILFRFAVEDDDFKFEELFEAEKIMREYF